ncbi:MAG: site-2 protease family protein [Candidatus Micrarchaeota archaeon]|nr:site-2 protease family protein [Candidatus Micrarchaeota archaeon]
MKRKFSIDWVEINDIAIATIAISIALVIAFTGIQNLIKFSIVGIAKQMGIMILTVGMAFILHEMAHKAVAQHYGAYAAFRVWPLGLLMALVFSVFGFVLAAPGAVYIYAPHITRKQNGLISLAGPVTNMVLALAFAALLPVVVVTFGPQSILSEIALIGYSINGILALFNLLPIFPLDGSKVLSWNWIIWVGAFATALLIYIAPALLFG